MNRLIGFTLITAATAIASMPASAQQPIRGFPSALLAEQTEREANLRAIPSADTVRQQIRIMSEEPHEAGSPGSLRVAEHILERFRSYGLDAEIVEYEALMPRPILRELELLSPTTYTAVLSEQPFPEDEDTYDENQLPPYNAYSADGDVTAELVFVNYGLPEDYRTLDSLGISVEGKIVIAKYGRSWRGIKPKLAAERGAVGTLIYSDPRDDGYWVNDVYPKGPMRPEHGVQRGSIMDMPIQPGDPVTPGWASVPGGERLDMEDAFTIMTIPVLPISYGDALPLLEALEGPVAPNDWKGALPLTYHVGPGPATVRLALSFDWETRPVYNVVGKIPGAVYPDQWIVHGNHHDSWVHGAADPVSGQAALGEAARALGTAYRNGWRPDRTIVFAAWDAEEWGLIGSTEWVEDNLEELREKAVVYLNTDSNNRGWVNVGGSHSLQTFFTEVARDIVDPRRDMTLLDAWLDRRDRGPAGDRPDTLFTISALGSGSDYTAFLDYAGIASGNIGFGGEASSGAYHSAYDTFAHYSRFGDTTFLYGSLLGQFMATSIARLADAPVLPFEFTNAARTYRQYAREIESTARGQAETDRLDLSQVHSAIDRLEQSALRYEAVLAGVQGLTAGDVQSRRDALAAANRALYLTERRATDEAGLPERDWFKHLFYAPGFYTGYGVKTLPGIREAVEDVPDLGVAQTQAGRVADALNAYATQVEEATTLLEQALR